MGEIKILFCIKKKNKAFSKQVTIQEKILCCCFSNFVLQVKRHQSFKKNLIFLPKSFLWGTKLLHFTLFLLEKGYTKPTKRRNKYLEKTLKTWKNHGILLISCSGNPAASKWYLCWLQGLEVILILQHCCTKSRALRASVFCMCCSYHFGCQHPNDTNADSKAQVLFVGWGPTLCSGLRHTDNISCTLCE